MRTTDLLTTTEGSESGSSASERTKLELRWQGGDVSTEELRLTLQRYREFFHRLLDAPSTVVEAPRSEETRAGAADDAEAPRSAPPRAGGAGT